MSTLNSRPKPFEVYPLRVRVVRGPRAEDGAWYFRAERYIDGRSVDVWSGWGHRDDVARHIATLVAEGRDDEPQGRRNDRVETVEDLLEFWLSAQLGRPISDHTKRNNIKAAKHLVRRLADKAVARLNTATLQTYYDERRTQDGAASRTVGNEVSTVIQAWNWARGQEHPLVPDRQLKRPLIRHRDRLTRYLPDTDEFWAVWNAVPESQQWAKTMLILMEATGARSGEIADLTWSDINWRRKQVRLDGKTGERWIRLAERALDWLRPIRPRRAVGRVLTVTRTTAVKTLRVVLVNACEVAGVRYFSPKQIRAMVENRPYDAGGDPDVVSQFMGHTPEVSLRNYRKAKKRRVDEVLLAAGIGDRPADGPDVPENVVSLDERRRQAVRD